jgi:hypothetical protein
MKAQVRVALIAVTILFTSCNNSKTPPAGGQGTAANAPAPGCTAQTSFQITSPGNGTVVPNVPTVQGTFGTPGKQILVIVHPLATGAGQAFWPQQPLGQVGTDCSWNIAVHVGEPGTQNEAFEIQAFENAQLLPGAVTLPNWPAAANHSNVVKVVRE